MSEERLRKVYAEESDKLLSYIRRIIGRRVDIYDESDILQETFFALLNGAATFTAVDNIRAYIYRSIRNRITDLYRRPQIRTDAETAPDDLARDETMSQALERRETMEMLTEALKALPPKQKEILIQTEFEGETFREVSEETGVSINALLSRKRYAIAHLKEIASEW